VSRIINCDFKWIKKDSRGFFEGDVVFPLIETILAVVPLNFGCGVAGLHSSGILACFLSCSPASREMDDLHIKARFLA